MIMLPCHVATNHAVERFGMLALLKHVVMPEGTNGS